MYDYTLKCTYKSLGEDVDEELSDDLYRVQLLQAFRLDGHDEFEIDEEVGRVRDKIRELQPESLARVSKALLESPQFTKLVALVGSEPDTAFRFLFGYHTFSEAHDWMSAILRGSDALDEEHKLLSLL